MDGDLRIGAWLVRPRLNTVSRNGTTHHLEPKVMEVLVWLAHQAGEPVSKEKLLRSIWPDTFVTDDVLVRSISELRRVFEDDPKNSRVIQTIPKRGYRLLAPMSPANGAEAGTADISGLENGRSGPAVRRWEPRKLTVVGIAVLLGSAWIGLTFSKAGEGFAGNRGGPQIHALAVLPLRNLSADPTQEYFADGMTDELITYISQINGLRVISYASIYPYKDTKKSLPVIARELGVDAIVEGSVQHAGNRVRVNAQLISAPQETHLWAQSYDRDLQDALTLQSTLAAAIADQVKIKLTPSQQARLQASHPVNLKALEAYLQGDHHLSKVGGRFSAEEARKAIAYFQQAVQEDPTFAAAYLKICQVYESQAILFSKADRWPAQKAAAEKALSLDPNLSGAHLAVGNVKLAYEWDLPAARVEFERALELDPNNVAAHDDLGDLLQFTNHSDEGWRQHEVAQELDPGGDHFTATFFRTRHYDRAIELLRKRAEVQPDDGGIHYSLSNNYAQLSMQKEHVAEFQETAKLFGYPEVADAVGRSYTTHGYRAALREMARQMEHYYSAGQLDRPVQVAVAYARMGDKDKVLNWLERAYTDHDEDLMGAFQEAEWDFVRSDPRFRALEQNLGLPQ